MLDMVLAGITGVYQVQCFTPDTGSICSHPQILLLTKRKWQIRNILPHQHMQTLVLLVPVWYLGPFYSPWQQLGQMQNLALGLKNKQGNKAITFSPAWGSNPSSHLLQFTINMSIMNSLKKRLPKVSAHKILVFMVRNLHVYLLSPLCDFGSTHSCKKLITWAHSLLYKPSTYI